MPKKFICASKSLTQRLQNPVASEHSSNAEGCKTRAVDLLVRSVMKFFLSAMLVLAWGAQHANSLCSLGTL